MYRRGVARRWWPGKHCGGLAGYGSGLEEESLGSSPCLSVPEGRNISAVAMGVMIEGDSGTACSVDPASYGGDIIARFDRVVPGGGRQNCC